MQDSIQKIVVAASGVGATEIVSAIVPPDPTAIAESGGLIIQIIIGIVTLWKLLKGNRKKEAK